MTSQFIPTVTNMVASVRNIIEGYVMGSMRALAQEPVQNSKDAAPRGRARVEYRLHRRRATDGSYFHLLTITDSNTTGLRGPVHSLADITQGGALNEGENWAAFEGMGYTKKGSEDALGSRGQGKAAYLYHSSLPSVSSSGQERMMMLYDTLLPEGEYRLGVRYANPSDTIRQPPFLQDEARHVVSTRYAEDGTEVELGLDPLAQVGTRVIVPYLSPEAVDAINSGELYQWLQRCWWRAVQTGLSIDVVDEDGSTQSVAVPQCWATEPWRRQTPGIQVYENIDVTAGLKIKRIVLLYDESLREWDPQFWGVQLLRGQQWIETLGESLGDYVPRDKRPGFRGFVEFERGAERELRGAENSQHERFDRRVSGVKELITAIENKVREFAEEQGWSGHESTRPAPTGEREAALEFMRFLSPRGRTEPSSGNGVAQPPQLRMDLAERWACELGLDFPNPQSTRVDWGQYVRDLAAAVRLEPASTSRQATVSLELARVDDRSSKGIVGSQPVHLQNGEGIARFGDFQIITGTSRQGKLQCGQQGKWRFTARVEADGIEVARASRSMFVNEDPPERRSKPYALSISVQNHTTGQRRINNGDIVGVQISVTNNTQDDQELALTASLGDLLLADMTTVDTRGVPTGATSPRIPGVQTRVVVNPAAPPAPPRQSVNLPPGRHALRADLYLNGKIVAYASRTLDVEIDPAQLQDWPPFRIEQVSGNGPHPRWQFDKRDPDNWVLQYPPAYPLYRALETSPGRIGDQLAGVSAFVVDVCAEGIIEWVMDPLDSGDRSRVDELLSGTPVGANPDHWEDYCDKMQELAALRSHPEQLDEYGRLVRDCAARSLSLFEERG